MPISPDQLRDAAKVTASDKDLTALSNYITALQLEEAELAKMEQAIQLKGEYIRKLTEVTIPEKMDALGLQDFTTKEGVKVSVKPFYGGNIKEADKPAAFEWLRAFNKGALIKTNIGIQFGMGEEEKAKELQASLEMHMIPFVAKEAVHPSSLVAFIKESMEAGVTLPPVFGAFAGKKAKIKTKKETE